MGLSGRAACLQSCGGGPAIRLLHDIVDELRWDGYTNGTLPPEYLLTRALRGETFPGGTGVMLVSMCEYKKCLLTDAWKCHGIINS